MKTILLILTLSLAILSITGCGIESASAQETPQQPESEQQSLRNFGGDMTKFQWDGETMVIIKYETVQEYGINVLRMHAECLNCNDIKPMYFYYDHLQQLYEQNPDKLPGMIGTAVYSDGLFVCESIETGETHFAQLALQTIEKY